MNALIMIIGNFASQQDEEVIKSNMSNQKEQESVGKWEAAALTNVLFIIIIIIFSKDNSMEDESEPLSKRHSDGIFTDSYSRYRKQMAVQKYLAAVLGRRYRQRVRNKGRRLAYL